VDIQPKDTDFIATEAEMDAVVSNIYSDGIYNKLISHYPLLGTSNKWVTKFMSFGKLKIYEWEIITPNTSSEWLANYMAEENEEFSKCIAPLNVLYTTKMAHRFKPSKHFAKTRADINMMASFGAEITEDLMPYYKLRELESNTKRHPILKSVSKGEFFTDNIDYIFDHDSLHEAFKLYDRPAYTYYIKGGEEVECCYKKWSECPHDVKIAGVVEEAAVLAFERAVLPHNVDSSRALVMALDKVCTSITSGWFREFAWENYSDIYFKLMSIDYSKNSWYSRFNEANKAGIIKPFKENRYA
jgi:hypothetical protein